MNFKMESFNTEELDKVVDLFCIVWGGERTKVEEKTKWAFVNNFSLVIVVKNDKNEIIAVRGGIRWPLEYNGKTIQCYQLHGTCVHPDYRRRGIFSKMNLEFVKKATEEGVTLIYNVSVKASRLGYEKIGWKYLKGFHRLTRIHPFNLSKKSNDIISDDNQETKMSLIKRSKNSFKNLVYPDYNANFLEWRLKNHTEKYEVFTHENSYVIYKVIVKNNKKQLIIGEVFLSKNSFIVFRRLLTKLFALVKPQMSISYIFKHHPYYNYYLLLLFLPNPLNLNLNFGVRRLGEMPDFTDHNWGLSFLDIDTF